MVQELAHGTGTECCGVLCVCRARVFVLLRVEHALRVLWFQLRSL